MAYNFPPQFGCNVTLSGPSLQSLCSAAEFICFMTALDEAIRSNPNISGNCERIKPINETAEEYDFIVAGAGAGGAVVAGRLAEITDWKILVLEAGKDESAAGQIPSFASTLLGSEIDWNYYTSNESYACLSSNGSCSWSSAKSLGGNTAHNYMSYLRGNPTDYNNWAAMGNDGWSWDEVLEFYKMQENNANINEVGRDYHNTGGPLNVEYFPYDSEITEPLLKAAEESGFGVSKDLNGKDPTGMSVIQSTQKHGVRMSSSKAYLWPHRDSKNLEISLDSHVTKVMIENKTAVGVEYIKNGELRSVRAKREVIVSTGTVRSPQLLLLSGIGPKKHLESKGIKVISDLPGVGQNLHDHVGSYLYFTMNRTDTYVNNVFVANEYLQNQTGPMSYLGGINVVGAGHTNRTSLEYPDFQLFFAMVGASCAPGKVDALRSDQRRQLTVSVVNVHPKSRGRRVSLASKNPLDHPLLWANYLSEPNDLAVILDGIEIALKLTEAESLRMYNLSLVDEPLEACSNHTFRSRDYWACTTQQGEATVWHPVGSCKMGPASDPMAVVDPELRVHGIKNLRIVDASIMPKGGCNVTLPGPSLQSLCSAAEYLCFMTALDAAIRSNPNISGNCERIKPIDEVADEYDFIVVGGGAGGATVAGRLAEITDWNTLLLEAGDDESVAGQVPGFTATLVGSEIDWNYYTNNESYACLDNNGSCYISSAKSLGGNTAHNDMIYLRGSPKNFDNWAALGNDGWAWDDVFKFYKKQEDNENIDKVGLKYHGTGGPLSVGFSPYVSKSTEAFLMAAEQSGFGVSKDLNGKNLTGLTVVQLTQKHGVRMSSSRAYLWPHRNNKTLEISLNSLVTKIIIENNTAVGVEYIKNGKLRSVRAKREIIVSAGSMRSPQLLLLSGIGPKKHLEAKGIKPVLDLPGVGENFHDHPAFLVNLTINRTDFFENNVRVAEKYLLNQTGPLSIPSEFFFLGLGHTNKTTPDFPDLLFLLEAYFASCAPGNVSALRSDGRRDVTIYVANYRPKSRGRVSLASNDPLDHPFLWLNYLSDPSDMEVMLDAIEMALKLIETEALKAFNFTLALQPVEACSNYTIPSRGYWACVIRQQTLNGSHQAGSCKMGPASDPMAVVDPELRVRGIKNLRVVDTSIMPQVTSANTAAPTMMIGERGAAFIKKTWLTS